MHVTFVFNTHKQVILEQKLDEWEQGIFPLQEDRCDTAHLHTFSSSHKSSYQELLGTWGANTPGTTPRFWAFDSHQRKEQAERGENAFKERERTQSEEKNCRKSELELSKVKAINCFELRRGKKHANDRVVPTKEWLLCRLTMNYYQQVFTAQRTNTSHVCAT